MAVSARQRRWSELFAARTRSGAGDGIAAILGLVANPQLISFAGGLPDPSTFPAERAAEVLAELAAAGDASAFQYAPTQGLPGTLDVIAARLEALQGQLPREDELLVTSGGIEALELVAKSFLDAGDSAVVEGPTYLGAIMAFRGFEAEVVAVDVDAGGLRVDELERRLADGLRPKLLYTIPDHQNPAGVTLAAERRPALVELARRYGFLIVEDVAYRELGFEEAAPSSLWRLGPDVVLQAGTTSKTFFPGVRLGWAAGPAEVVAQLVSAKQNTDQCAGALGQRLYEEAVAPRLARRADRPLARPLRAPLLPAPGGARTGACRLASSGRGRMAASSRGLAFRSTRQISRSERPQRASRSSRVRSSIPDGRGERNLRLSFSGVADDLIDVGIARLARLLES